MRRINNKKRKKKKTVKLNSFISNKGEAGK